MYLPLRINNDLHTVCSPGFASSRHIEKLVLVGKMGSWDGAVRKVIDSNTIGSDLCKCWRYSARVILHCSLILIVVLTCGQQVCGRVIGLGLAWICGPSGVLDRR